MKLKRCPELWPFTDENTRRCTLHLGHSGNHTIIPPSGMDYAPDEDPQPPSPSAAPCPFCGAGDGLSLPDSLARMRSCLDCELDSAPPECEAHRRAIPAELEQTYTPQAVAAAWADVLRGG